MGQSSQTTDSKVSPWDPQAQALTGAFSNAQTAYGKASGSTAPTDFTAQFTPDQLSVFQKMLGFGNNSSVPANEASNGATLTNAGTAGATGALTSLGAFDPSSTNNMDANVAGAKSYASGLDIPGAVKNAMQSATEQARDVTLPGMESSAAGNGNINSSRTGLSEGIVQRGLAEKAADLNSQMTNDAYTTGAGLTSSTNTANNSALLTALQNAGVLGTGLVGQGVGAQSSSVADAGNLFNIANMGGTGEQSSDQANLTNLMQRYQSSVSSPYDALNGLMSIIGSNNWGSNGTSTTTSSPSAFQIIGGLMGAGGSLAGGLGKMGLTLSDRNAKEEIHRIGQTDDGIPIYRFRYKGDRRVTIGFMAQEIEQINPDAVRTVEGVKFVDYDEATKHLV